MRASEIIIESLVCRQASRNIYPQDPDELFNTCWLIIREMELKDISWIPNNPKNYFLRMMRNKVLEWKKQTKLIALDKLPEQSEIKPSTPENLPCKAFVTEWIETPSKDEDELFLKNILTLAVYTKITTDAIKMTGISRKAFYHYLKIAKQKLYDDYHASNNNHIHSACMV